MSLIGDEAFTLCSLCSSWFTFFLVLREQLPGKIWFGFNKVEMK
jgi:hypothetical protein